MEDILDAAVLGEEDFDDEDLDDALLLHIFHGHNLGNRAELYGRFDFEAITDIEAKSYFRFEKNDIPRLAIALNIPNSIATDDNISLPGNYKSLDSFVVKFLQNKNYL